MNETVFLDDRLNEICSRYDFKDINWGAMADCGKACLRACIDSLEAGVGGNDHAEVFEAQMRRVDRTWRNHVKGMEARGVFVFQASAFENIVAKVIRGEA